ncbi:hypothetical protein PS1_031248 [Malus domestica]
MLGISVHGQKILIDPTAFAIRDGGKTGGCFLDNGSTLSYLITRFTPAFKALIQFLEMYFMRFPCVVKTNESYQC